jgi:uncharacterized Zn finger protein
MPEVTFNQVGVSCPACHSEETEGIAEAAIGLEKKYTMVLCKGCGLYYIRTVALKDFPSLEGKI